MNIAKEKQRIKSQSLYLKDLLNKHAYQANYVCRNILIINIIEILLIILSSIIIGYNTDKLSKSFPVFTLSFTVIGFFSFLFNLYKKIHTKTNNIY